LTNSGLDALLPPLAGDVLSMPAFSPDGTMLAAVRSASSGDNVLPVNPKIDRVRWLRRGLAVVRRNAQYDRLVD
jgi:hypothetical protein